MDHVKDIQSLFRKFFGIQPEEIFPLPPTASNRLYYRLRSGDQLAIGAFNPDKAENDAFLYISAKLKDAGVHVPEVYQSDKQKFVYLIQDIGDIKLLDLVEEYKKNNDPDYLLWYKRVLDQMPLIQYRAAKDFDFTKCFPRNAFDKQSILWDLNYFKYYFLKLAYIPFHEQMLENDFQMLSEFLIQAPRDFFLFRDFQSRNIMIYKNDVYFIDYQGGRKGALQYDLASLLFEAKVGLSEAERSELLNYYLHLFSSFEFFNQEIFLQYYPAYILIRLLQAFGAYGYRGYFERKSFFLQSIPPALNNLKSVLQNYDLEKIIPYLSKILDRMIQSYENKIPLQKENKLNITINSFSYKKSVPEDFSGNGGGFVFDCRALPNPGRYEKYRTKTGKDAEVKQFLSQENRVQLFLENTKNLVASSIDNYLERSFEHLMISFGCTGGQHRSVFCAEELGHWILKQYDNVNLNMNHLELGGKLDDKNNVP